MPKTIPKRSKHWTRPALVSATLVLIQLVQSSAILRRALSEYSIAFFSWWYLGVFLGWHQEVWAHKVQKSKRIVMMAPRDHGKTEVVSKIYPLWRIVRNRDIRIIMLTKASHLATANSMLIRGELEHNDRLIADYGAFYHHKLSTVWQQAKWQVVRDKKMKDPTFYAIGVDSAATGNRCDILILDDVIDEESVTTPEKIHKLDRLIRGTYMPLVGKTGQTIVIGTRKNYNDLYGALLKERGWVKVIQQGVIRMPPEWHFEDLDEPYIDDDGYERWEKVVIDGEDRGVVLWPGYRPIEWLLEQRMVMSAAIWEREIQNNPVDEETAMFPMAYLDQCKDETLSYITGRITPRIRKRFQIVMSGCDPALVTTKADAERRDSDHMAMYTIGLTKRQEYVLLAADHARGLSPAKVEERMETFYRRCNPYRMAIERNAFGILHIHNLIENTNMRIIPHLTTMNKRDPYEGVGHLSPLFERMKFRLPYKTARDKAITDGLCEELHAFGADIHDDRVMALWITCFALLRYLRGQARLRRIKAAANRERVNS